MPPSIEQFSRPIRHAHHHKAPVHRVSHHIICNYDFNVVFHSFRSNNKRFQNTSVICKNLILICFRLNNTNIPQFKTCVNRNNPFYCRINVCKQSMKHGNFCPRCIAHFIHTLRHFPTVTMFFTIFLVDCKCRTSIIPNVFVTIWKHQKLSSLHFRNAGQGRFTRFGELETKLIARKLSRLVGVCGKPYEPIRGPSTKQEKHSKHNNVHTEHFCLCQLYRLSHSATKKLATKEDPTKQEILHETHFKPPPTTSITFVLCFFFRAFYSPRSHRALDIVATIFTHKTLSAHHQIQAQ